MKLQNEMGSPDNNAKIRDAKFKSKTEPVNPQTQHLQKNPAFCATTQICWIMWSTDRPEILQESA